MTLFFYLFFSRKDVRCTFVRTIRTVDALIWTFLINHNPMGQVKVKYDVDKNSSCFWGNSGRMCWAGRNFHRMLWAWVNSDHMSWAWRNSDRISWSCRYDHSTIWAWRHSDRMSSGHRNYQSMIWAWTCVWVSIWASTWALIWSWTRASYEWVKVDSQSNVPGWWMCWCWWGSWVLLTWGFSPTWLSLRCLPLVLCTLLPHVLLYPCNVISNLLHDNNASNLKISYMLGFCQVLLIILTSKFPSWNVLK